MGSRVEGAAAGQGAATGRGSVTIVGCEDDDDDFLYGGETEPAAAVTPTAVTPSSASLTTSESTPPIITQLQEAEASGWSIVSEREAEVETENGEEEDEQYETTDDEEDVEIIMEPQSRSLDLRSANARLRASAPLKTPALGSSETTDYTPLQRGASLTSIPNTPTPAKPAPAATATPQPTPAIAVPAPVQPQPQPDVLAAVADGVDPATLPPVTAMGSQPAIDPGAMGLMDGRPVIDVDLSSMTDKAWRRPGSDISDWFNYGFDELSWEAYCYRRRDLGELANVLKTNVLNFAGLTEEQLTVLPPEARTMVMTGTQAMMNGAMNGGGVAPMMGMMDMGGMMPMGMPVGDMSMMGMQDAGVAQQVAQEQQESMMMGMGMEQQYAQEPPQSQSQSQSQSQQMYPMDPPPQGNIPTGPGGMGRGAPPYRGTRGLRGVRGAGGFVGRGRGRGGYEGVPTAPARPTSPLPPNVPTGPRNQNKYKDRDGNAAAVDGLDYGGGKGDRTPSGEPEDRGRKRRISPSLEDRRDSKRR
ncbi:Fip1 domain-containing protein [Mycena chlorophos]|uniref:Fip1 domain-containing protein n=1 Tax=Mycena chlorophos TaxID=658473 RepID=A0A8H6W222_MYCCL|nr:Fip1 domain-containing protein [Mycena chlorophos]